MFVCLVVMLVSLFELLSVGLVCVVQFCIDVFWVVLRYCVLPCVAGLLVCCVSLCLNVLCFGFSVSLRAWSFVCARCGLFLAMFKLVSLSCVYV